MGYTLIKEPHGFYCKYTDYVTPDDFLDAMVEVNAHPYFRQATYCIHDFLCIDGMRKGKTDLALILAHSLGGSTSNPRVKIAIITTDENTLTFATWYQQSSDENVAYFEMPQVARSWADTSTWRKITD